MNNTATARENILSNLRISSVVPDITSRKYPVMEYKRWSLQEKVEQLKQKMEAVHTEVLHCSKSSWGRMFRAVVKEKNIEKILYGTNTDLAQKLREMYQQTPEEIPELVDYKKPIEESKDLLFGIDAAITTILGGIAETGSLILWPTPEEPRLMSLIPPIHIAVLYADTIYNNFLEAMTTENWNSEMPSNALLISGPSKTADIEQTLVYGVHGCKELVVLLIQ